MYVGYHRCRRCLLLTDMSSNLGFGYEFNSLHNPNDPFAVAYDTIFNQSLRARVYGILSNYLPILRMLPLPHLLKLAQARKSISLHARQLVRDKESKATVDRDILSLMIAENR